MKKINKLLFALLFFVVCTVNVNAAVKENVADYTDSDKFIIGNTRFDGDEIITAKKVITATKNQTKLNLALGMNTEDALQQEVKVYFYSSLSEEWYVQEDTYVAVTEEEEIKEIEENLNIFFVNNEEKVLEFEYEGNPEDITNGVTYDKETGTFKVPATAINFEFKEAGETHVVYTETENTTGDDLDFGSFDVIAKEEVVATVGTAQFDNLQDALNASTEANPAQLVTDLVLDKSIIVTNVSVLDLNNKTIIPTETFNGTALIYIPANAKLTITGTGTINSASQANDYSMLAWAYNGGELVIENGTFTNLGAKDMEDNGTTPNNNELIYVSAGGKLTITGGKFIGNTENKTYGAKFTLNKLDNDNSVILVTGGTFVGYNPADSKTEPTKANFVSAGYKITENNGSYTVATPDKKDVALIGTVAYQNLQEALNNAHHGETVLLVNNVKYENCNEAPLKYQAEDENIEAILDLNGYTVSATLNNGKSISLIKVGNVNPDRKTGTATLTINDSSDHMSGTLTVKPTVESDGWDVSVSTISVERLGRLIVNEGNIITEYSELSTGGNPYAIDVLTNTGAQTAELTINGGYIESRSLSGMGIRFFANSSKAAIKFVMNGGEVVGASNGRGIWFQQSGGSTYHLIEATINGGKVIADRALEIGDFNLDEVETENIQITLNGGEFVSTNKGENPKHPTCDDLYTGKNTTYYNQTFNHVKLVDNRAQ